MPVYDFSTLNSSDLEELACDLMNLNEPEGSIIEYKTFKDGKDQGIDFLYSTSENDHEHVGQVKHYSRTGYLGLLSSLKSTEVDKVKLLKPNKYLFFTSVDLSTAQTKELKSIFKPYIKNLKDIYGKKGINKLIGKHSEILELHYKLWLNDFAVLKKIFECDMDFKSSHFVEEEIKKRLRLFVKTPLFEKAKNKLAEKKFIVISGEPGVGKTTLAEMLCYEFIGKDFKLSYVEEPHEIDKILKDDDSKQIIYYDDFLGSNFAEINKAQESESKLLRIVKQISRSENKYLILTTRSLLLTKVSEESEKIKRFGLIPRSDLLELKEYSKDIKKELLKNHIEESELREDYKIVLQNERLIDFIIGHRTFTPRSIEYITLKSTIEDNEIKIEGYEKFIRKNFDYPQEIWKHAYNNQITEDDRLLLNTLFSFKSSPSISELEDAFITRINYEIKNNNKTKKTHAFKRSLNRMEGGFIIKKGKSYSFINPSVNDFLINYLKEDQDEMERITSSIKYISQFSEQTFNSVGFTPKLSEEFKTRLIEDHESFLRNDYMYQDTDLIQLTIVINKYLSDDEKVEKVTIEVLDKIVDWESLHDNYELNIQFRKFLDMVKHSNSIMETIKDSSIEIVNDLVMGESDIAKSIEILGKLKDTFQLDFTASYFHEIEGHFDQLFYELIENEIEWLNDFITDESEAYEKESEIQNLIDELNNIGFYFVTDLSEFKKDWWEVAMHNEMRRVMDKDD